MLFVCSVRGQIQECHRPNFDPGHTTSSCLTMGLASDDVAGSEDGITNFNLKRIGQLLVLNLNIHVGKSAPKQLPHATADQ